MKCYVPGCNKEIPKSKRKMKRVTCSKRCSGIYHWMPSNERKKIRMSSDSKQNANNRSEE